MSKGPPLQELKLTVQENNQLIEWTRQHKTSQALGAARAHHLGVRTRGEQQRRGQALPRHPPDGGQVRSRFLERRLDGLLDEPRPGAPRKHDDAKIERLIATTLNERSAEATHWSTVLLASQWRVAETSVASRTSRVVVNRRFSAFPRISGRSVPSTKQQQ